MEIDNAIFQDLDIFGKGAFSKMAVEMFRIFVWENYKNIQNGYNLALCLLIVPCIL